MFRLLHKPELRKRMPPKAERANKVKSQLLELIKGKNTSTLAYANALDNAYFNACWYSERILTIGTYYEKDNINFNIALEYYISKFDFLDYKRDFPLIKLASTVLPHINPRQAYWGPGCMKVIRDYKIDENGKPMWLTKWEKGPRKKKKSVRDSNKKPRLIYDMNINRWI